MTVLYVYIDRPEDADASSHEWNIAGVRGAAAEVGAEVEVVHARDVPRRLQTGPTPIAIFGAGSFTEWFQYGVDSSWRATLDRYFRVIRETVIPMFAVCGSHQVIAAAFNGWGAVAHMNDGAGVPIATELVPPVKPRFPSPRVGEEGTYPVAVTEAGVDDPIVGPFASEAIIASSHHKDMVVDTRGFTLLLTGDPSRKPHTTADGQVASRCRVQGMKLDDPSRLLYSVQFHPEIRRFAEGTVDDGGFGHRLLVRFLREAQMLSS